MQPGTVRRVFSLVFCFNLMFDRLNANRIIEYIHFETSHSNRKTKTSFIKNELFIKPDLSVTKSIL